MKADKFLNVLRTIISEEVRKAVREELNTALVEGYVPETNKTAKIAQKSSVLGTSLRDKYKSVLDEGYNVQNSAVPLNKQGKPAIVNLSGNSTVNSILLETAQQMRQDPHSNSFFEGLR